MQVQTNTDNHLHGTEKLTAFVGLERPETPVRVRTGRVGLTRREWVRWNTPRARTTPRPLLPATVPPTPPRSYPTPRRPPTSMLQ